MKDRSSSISPWRSMMMMLLVACISGCAKSYRLDTEDFVPKYPLLEEPLPLKVALVVPKETRRFAYKIPLRRWEMGAALESHMSSALKAAFKDVVSVPDEKSASGVDRIFVCSLGASTSLKVGLLVTSDHTATVDLGCQVLDASRVPLWEGRILRSDTFNAGIIGKMLLASSISSLFIKGVDVVGSEEKFEAVITDGSNNSLVLAVEQFMEKMLKEGQRKICPNCTGNADWRKTK